MPKARCTSEHCPRRYTGQHAVVHDEYPVCLVVWCSLWNAAQLIKKEMNRTVGSYAYLAALGVIALGMNVNARAYDQQHPDPVATVAFLVGCAIAMNLANVRIERGRLSLGAIAIGAAAILT